MSDKIARLTCNQHQGFGEVGYMSWEASKKKNNFKIYFLIITIQFPHVSLTFKASTTFNYAYY